MNIFTLLRKKEGSLHWYGQRVTALLAAPLMVLIIFKGALIVQNNNDIYQALDFFKTNYNFSLMITALFLIWHSKTGIESIIDDYVHHEQTKFLAYSAIRVVALMLMKYTYIFLSF